MRLVWPLLPQCASRPHRWRMCSGLALHARSGDAAAVDTLSHSARLARMARRADYPLTIVAINPINRRLVRPLARLGVSPNAVTFASFATGIVAAYALYLAAQAVLWAQIAAPMLVFAAHVLDALDGDLARYADRKSRFGEMVDPALDRAREVAYALGAAFGLWAAGVPEAALAAACCIGATQTYYYTADAQIARVMKVKANDIERYDLTLSGVGETRVKFGLYEPYMYGLALAVSVGWGLEALWSFAGIFGVFWVRQLFKLRRELRRADGASS